MLNKPTLSIFCSIKRYLTTNFKNSPSDKPGFVLYDTVEQLGQCERSLRGLPILSPFQAWKQTQNRLHLGTIRSTKSLEKAIGQYENQEPINMVQALKIHSRYSSSATEYLEGAISEALEVSNVIGSVDNNILIDPAASPLEQMQLMSIMKWRKRKMRGHKYQKRLRKNRYKSKV